MDSGSGVGMGIWRWVLLGILICCCLAGAVVSASRASPAPVETAKSSKKPVAKRKTKVPRPSDAGTSHHSNPHSHRTLQSARFGASSAREIHRARTSPRKPKLEKHKAAE